MLRIVVDPPKLTRFEYAAQKLGESVAMKIYEIFSRRPEHIRGYLIHSIGWIPLLPDEQAEIEQAAANELEDQLRRSIAMFTGEGPEGGMQVDGGGEIDWGAILPKYRKRSGRRKAG